MLKERLIYGLLIFSVYFVYKSVLLEKHTCSHHKIFEACFTIFQHYAWNSWYSWKMLLRNKLQQTKQVLCKYGFSVGRGEGEILSHPLYIPFILLNFPFNRIFKIIVNIKTLNCTTGAISGRFLMPILAA